MTLLLYVAVASCTLLFVVASVARAVTYARSPLHLRWELYPVPHESPDRVAHGGSYFEGSEWWKTPRHVSRRGELAFMVPEILFLRALHEFNRPLWLRSFPFHAGLYLVAGAGGLLMAAAAGTLIARGASAGAAGAIVHWMTILMGAAGLVLSIGGAAALLHRRVTDPALRAYTTVGDHLNLLFFIVAFGMLGIGYLARPPGSPGALAIAIGLLSWDLTLPVSPRLVAGILPAAALMVYIPLTHMSHFVGKYFTYHAVRWDDAPLVGNKALAASLAEYLTYRPTWSARHIHTGRADTWAEIVAARPAQGKKS